MCCEQGSELFHLCNEAFLWHRTLGGRLRAWKGLSVSEGSFVGFQKLSLHLSHSGILALLERLHPQCLHKLLVSQSSNY